MSAIKYWSFLELKTKMSSSSSFSSIYSNASTHTQGKMENKIDESEQFEAKSGDEESHQYLDVYSDEPIADEI